MPKPMSPQEVFELAGLLSQMTQDQIDALIVELQREQPDLYDYFQDLHRLFPDSREYNDVMGIAYTVWQILKRSAAPPGRVTVEMIAWANESYLAEIKRLIAGSDAARKEAAAHVALGHPEPAMLAYLVVAMKQVSASWQERTLILANNALRVVLDALLSSRGHKPGRSLGMAPVGRA